LLTNCILAGDTIWCI